MGQAFSAENSAYSKTWNIRNKISGVALFISPVQTLACGAWLLSNIFFPSTSPIAMWIFIGLSILLVPTVLVGIISDFADHLKRDSKPKDNVIPSLRYKIFIYTILILLTTPFILLPIALCQHWMSSTTALLAFGIASPIVFLIIKYVIENITREKRWKQGNQLNNLLLSYERLSEEIAQLKTVKNHLETLEPQMKKAQLTINAMKEQNNDAKSYEHELDQLNKALKKSNQSLNLNKNSIDSIRENINIDKLITSLKKHNQEKNTRIKRIKLIKHYRNQLNNHKLPKTQSNIYRYTKNVLDIKKNAQTNIDKLVKVKNQLTQKNEISNDLILLNNKMIKSIDSWISLINQNKETPKKVKIINELSSNLNTINNLKTTKSNQKSCQKEPLKSWLKTQVETIKLTINGIKSSQNGQTNINELSKLKKKFETLNKSLNLYKTQNDSLTKEIKNSLEFINSYLEVINSYEDNPTLKKILEDIDNIKNIKLNPSNKANVTVDQLYSWKLVIDAYNKIQAENTQLNIISIQLSKRIEDAIQKNNPKSIENLVNKKIEAVKSATTNLRVNYNNIQIKKLNQLESAITDLKNTLNLIQECLEKLIKKNNALIELSDSPKNLKKLKIKEDLLPHLLKELSEFEERKTYINRQLKRLSLSQKLPLVKYLPVKNRWFNGTSMSLTSLLLGLITLTCFIIICLSLISVITLSQPVLYGLTLTLLALMLAFSADFFKDLFNLDKMKNTISAYLLLAYPIQRISLALLVISVVLPPNPITHAIASLVVSLLMISSLILAIQRLLRKHHKNTPVGQVAGYLLIGLGALGFFTHIIALSLLPILVASMLAINGLQLIFGNTFYYRLDDADFQVDIYNTMSKYYSKLQSSEKNWKGQRWVCYLIGLMDVLSAISLTRIGLSLNHTIVLSNNLLYSFITLTVILALLKSAVFIKKFFKYQSHLQLKSHLYTRNQEFKKAYMIKNKNKAITSINDIKEQHYKDNIGVAIIKDYAIHMAGHTQC